MNHGRTIFSQLMSHMPMPAFRKCVTRYRGNYKVKSFTCLEQFYCMAFGQLAYRDSLRSIVTCLRGLSTKLYHLGFRGTVSRNTLAHANETRDWRIYADFAKTLIEEARTLYVGEPFGVDLDTTAYALDSTTIRLCLSVFPWASYRERDGAIKLHTLLDLRGSIPAFTLISSGKLNDVNVLDEIQPEPKAFYVLDRGYLHFRRLYRLHEAGAFFVTRPRKNQQSRRVASRPVDRSSGLRCDQTIRLTGADTAGDFPAKLRRVRFCDAETGQTYTYFTNNFELPALTIAQLYKARWKIELFFKWIKQHLRIKAFYGTSENAVRTQVWIAIAVYVLVAIVKKRLKLPHSLYTILQVLSVTLAEKTPLLDALSLEKTAISDTRDPNQLPLFEI